jgi:hypothetical protein
VVQVSVDMVVKGLLVGGSWLPAWMWRGVLLSLSSAIAASVSDRRRACMAVGDGVLESASDSQK